MERLYHRPDEGNMQSALYDVEGHRRSPVIMPGFHEGRSAKQRPAVSRSNTSAVRSAASSGSRVSRSKNATVRAT